VCNRVFFQELPPNLNSLGNEQQSTSCSRIIGKNTFAINIFRSFRLTLLKASIYA